MQFGSGKEAIFAAFTEVHTFNILTVNVNTTV